MHIIIILCFYIETHDGVQDMACDTFIKIAQKCRRHFVTVQIGETFPFIDEILQNLRSIICDLSQQQVCRSVLLHLIKVYKVYKVINVTCVVGANLLRGHRVHDIVGSRRESTGQLD